LNLVDTLDSELNYYSSEMISYKIVIRWLACHITVIHTYIQCGLHVICLYVLYTLIKLPSFYYVMLRVSSVALPTSVQLT